MNMNTNNPEDLQFEANGVAVGIIDRGSIITDEIKSFMVTIYTYGYDVRISNVEKSLFKSVAISKSGILIIEEQQTKIDDAMRKAKKRLEKIETTKGIFLV